MNDHRLKTAAEFGAKTVKVTRDQSEEEFNKTVRTLLGDLPDITIDCGGFQSTVAQGLKVLILYTENVCSTHWIDTCLVFSICRQLNQAAQWL
jgi:threonine dehydrogenase-like Zn-dependent dehydrogenase